MTTGDGGKATGQPPPSPYPGNKVRAAFSTDPTKPKPREVLHCCGARDDTDVRAPSSSETRTRKQSRRPRHDGSGAAPFERIAARFDDHVGRVVRSGVHPGRPEVS